MGNIETFETRIERFSYGSVTPIALYRVVRAETQPRQELAVASTVVDLPLKRVPTIAEVQAERDHHQDNLEKARRAGAGLEALNPIQYHISWADDAIAQLEEGPYDRVAAFIQAIRIGDTAIVAIPGRPSPRFLWPSGSALPPGGPTPSSPDTPTGSSLICPAPRSTLMVDTKWTTPTTVMV